MRWFEPVPGSNEVGTSGAVELRFDGRGGLHFWFDRSRSDVTDPDLALRFRGRVPKVGRSGNVISIRLSTQDMSNPRAASASRCRARRRRRRTPARIPVVAAGDAMGTENAGFEWPGGQPAPLFDAGDRAPG